MILQDIIDGYEENLKYYCKEICKYEKRLNRQKFADINNISVLEYFRGKRDVYASVIFNLKKLL